jgi:Spy/CpxP family protein refolding chaperone
MKTGTKIVLMVGTIGLVALGSIALAGPGFGGREGQRPEGGFGDRMRLGERLGLTEEQRGKIKAVLESHKDEVRPLAEKMMAERKALRELIHAGTVDESAIRAQVAKAATVEADLAVARAKVAQEIQPLLSPEQKQRAKELKAEAEKRGAEFRERIAKGKPQD